MKNRNFPKNPKTIEKKMDELSSRVRKLWDQERQAINKLQIEFYRKRKKALQDQEKLEMALEKLRASCKSKSHPKLDEEKDVTCPDCGLERKVDYGDGKDAQES